MSDTLLTVGVITGTFVIMQYYYTYMQYLKGRAKVALLIYTSLCFIYPLLLITVAYSVRYRITNTNYTKLNFGAELMFAAFVGITIKLSLL